MTASTLLQLETVATGGVVVIVAILVVVVRAAAQAGFPAVRDGALPWFGVPEFSKLPERWARQPPSVYAQLAGALASIVHSVCTQPGMQW